ncbi:hypothetical protein MJO28_001754 [Puccinia striiformis f. sp. tritici]|uniref:Uncharacterized protein n=1 Tax=Puccinia striiformis f. sp. tritici TaxID=168172 RepID=A0ACC0EUW6_9BASI|nr:hypothetical protein MJO28_001754 [Puccinia striiformis f. sp. tritici]
MLEGSHCDRGSVNYSCQSTYLRLPATRAQLGAKLTSSVPVTVLVLPTCLRTMRKIYEPLTGVKVMPFYLSTLNLLLSRMLTLMGFDDSVRGVKSGPSLIDHAFISAKSNDHPKANERRQTFKKKMSKEPLNPAQECSYKMRIEMSDSYLTNQKSVNVFSYFKPGHLVILLLYSKSLLAYLFMNNVWKLGKDWVSSSLPPTLVEKQIYQNKNFSINRNKNFSINCAL